jgi:hypothetical protein
MQYCALAGRQRGPVGVTKTKGVRSGQDGRETRHGCVAGFNGCSVKRVVEGSFNRFRNKMLHVARVPSAFVIQRLNEKFVCEKRRAGVLCLLHKGRTGKGKCV